MLVSEPTGELDHNLMNIAHDFSHGPAKHIEVEKLMFLGLVFLDLLDVHLIFFNFQDSTFIEIGPTVIRS